MKYVFPENYGQDDVLVFVDSALLPLVGGALRIFEQRYSWLTDEDFEQGYNAFAKLQVELMGRSLERLIMEIRALRGVDDLQQNIFDPEADPFYLSLGTIMDETRQLETLNVTTEAIRLLVEQIQAAENLDELKAIVAQIALMLA